MVSAWFLVAEDYPIDAAAARAASARRAARSGSTACTTTAGCSRAASASSASSPRIHRHLREWGADGLPLARRAPARGLDAGAGVAATTPRSTTRTRSTPSRAAAARSCRTSSATWWSCRSRSRRTSRCSSSCASPTSGCGGGRPPGSPRHGGLVNVLVHPDYALTRRAAPALRRAARLPRRRWTAAGTRCRATSRAGGGGGPRSSGCSQQGGRPRRRGAGAAGASLWWAEERDGAIVIDAARRSMPELIPQRVRICATPAETPMAHATGPRSGAAGVSPSPIVAVAVLAAWAPGCHAPKSYEATARVLLGQRAQVDALLGASTTRPTPSGSSTRASSWSRSTGRRRASAAGSASSRPPRPYRQAERPVDRNSSVVSITARDPSPARAAQIANAFAAGFRDFLAHSSQTTIEDAVAAAKERRGSCPRAPSATPSRPRSGGSRRPARSGPAACRS